ncbi:site-specific recombinase [Clostridium cochlearium]|nr:site-specific recombinase [Clostridium cochlearium]
MSGYKVDLVMFFRFLKLYKTKLPKDIEFEEIDISDVDDEFIRKINLTDLYSFMAFLDN